MEPSRLIDVLLLLALITTGCLFLQTSCGIEPTIVVTPTSAISPIDAGCSCPELDLNNFVLVPKL